MTQLPILTAFTAAVPDKLTMSKDVFANSVYVYLEYFNTSFTPEMIAHRTAMNTLSSEVQAASDSATTKATLSTDYAEKTGLEVETGTYSSKEHAIGSLTVSGGSAKSWAISATSPDGTLSKSAKILADEASLSATAALTAQLAAEAALDSFDDRYLGSKTADPTLDNDGNPLTMGAMYYYTNSDPTLNKLKVYDSDLAVWTNMIFVPTSHTGLSGIGTKSHDQLESELAIKTNKSTSFFYGGF